MAKAIGSEQLSIDSQPPARSLKSVLTLRLVLGWIVLFGTIVFLLATCWDIQWHIAVGRDRTLTPPHLMILAGDIISGIAALAAVLFETLWVRRSPLLAQSSTRFAATFHSSLGAYIAGYAALAAAIAFPLDSYWHSLYGVDVAIWAPFHIMAIAAMTIAAFGAVFMLMSAANLASKVHASSAPIRLGNGAAHLALRAQPRRKERAVRVGYVGVIVALATMMGIYTIILVQAFGDLSYITLGAVSINVYPLMIAAFGALILVAAVHAIPWRAVATSITVVYLFLDLVIYLFVPPAMNALVQIEQQSFLPTKRGTPPVVLSFQWQYTLIIAAVLLDLAIYFARRKGWSPRLHKVVVFTTTMVSFVLVAVLNPLYIPSLLRHGDPLVILALSLPVGLLGAYVGSWIGLDIGKSLQHIER